ncbi:unnamed protein product [Cunninghamella blakesleeana]
MSNSKANLKAAREAIGKKDFDEAIRCCNCIILWESGNYNAYVFLGVAYAGLDNEEEAEKAYRQAIDINSEQLLAWQGLITLYEKKEKYEEVLKTIDHVLPLLILSGDGNRVVDYLNKKLDIYETKMPDEVKFIETLQQFLPTSKHYNLIKDAKNIPSTSKIYKYQMDLAERSDCKAIESTYKSRRFKINNAPSTAASLYESVEAEIYSKSDIISIYETLLEQPDDEVDKLDIQTKLLNIYRKILPAKKNKNEVYNKIMTIVNTLIEKNVDSSIPYEIKIEFTDVSSCDDYDENIVNILINQYGSSTTSKFLLGYRKYKEGDLDEAFDIFGDALEQSPQLLCGYLCLSWIYYNSNEFESGLEYATRGRDLVKKFGIDTGILLEKMLLSMELCMANCYKNLDSKYYPDALDIYKNILEKSPDNINALEGAGNILSQDKKYGEALSYFEKVLILDNQQHNAIAQIGWIYAEKEDYDKAIEFVTKAIKVSGDVSIADYYYKLGRIYWKMGGDYRNSSEYAFNNFMLSVKRNPKFSNGFAYLGHYYREISNDHIRAKKCYEKVMQLNPMDVEVAFHLSNYYVNDDELSKAEDLFKQITNSSPKTGWAWRRLGYAHMTTDNYQEAISCFQKSLRVDTNNVQCWEGLGEAYTYEGRYVAALKAFERATILDPLSINGNYQKALVKQKVGKYSAALEEFEATLALAEQQGAGVYLPALKGLADTYLAKVKEDFQQGFFGRAVDGCRKTIHTCLLGLQADENILGFWKLIGDACCLYRLMPSYLHMCAYDDIQEAIKNFAISAHQKLKFEHDHSSQLVDEFLQLEITSEFYLPPEAALDVMLACASFAYKQVIVLCHNHKSISPIYWHDLALVYHWMGENNLEHQSTCTLVATKCIQVALALNNNESTFWNTLGVISMKDSPKTSQYAFIKAMEYNSRSAIPWTNYGFLCLSLKDYELANKSFETAHSLDPDWISAWVGQAYVASIWGTEATSIFQHAFESSNGSALEASYGYANTVYQQLSSQVKSDEKINNTIIVAPAFALQKLTEQKLHDALSLNLLGLLSERLGQYQRAAEAFAGAILALEAKIEQQQDEENKNTNLNRLAQVHANLGRMLCATGDFQGAIHSYQLALQNENISSRVYCLLGAGIAHYFLDQLEEALQMFEVALNETSDNIQLRQDVVVLLSKVLWALGGDEQRSVAKDQLLACIADSPHYLPAIFSLSVMGILGNDPTLTTAALEELKKVPSEIAYEQDKDQWISWIFSCYYKLQGNDHSALRSLLKKAHQLPWVATLWSRLASESMTQDGELQNAKNLASIALVINRQQQSSADSIAKSYEDAASVTGSKSLAQRAIFSAPWRIEAWEALAAAKE